MIDYALNIIGSEWIIIIFVALILLFGTNNLPEAGKKIGKMVGAVSYTHLTLPTKRIV